ncbi:hypothetical protein ACFO4E_20070 [Nocardiopsis mangrovi]|uniref:Uncharacterized protein n=1 Tax=Nocardiopsis mangrovi TaxID=1179818 RepID=A0ABV9E3J6_9ACTN
MTSTPSADITEEEATGDACEGVDEALEARETGNALLAGGRMQLTLTQLQANRPYLDDEVVRIYEENFEEPEETVSLLADWCEENGY